MKINFEKNGFVIIKNAISKEHLNNLKKIINKSSNSSYDKFLKHY